MTKNWNERGATGIALVVVGSLVGLVLLIVGVYAIRWVTAEPRGALDQREKTIADGDYRIANYDYFFNLCGNIQAAEDKILNTEARPVSSEDSNSGFTQGQKDAILLALTNTRSELIRDYNASATKEDTAGHFRSSNLPYQIDPTQEATTCAA